jgi:hypothetical protein
VTELMILSIFAALAAVAVWIFVARAGRSADREADARRNELDALARMHKRYRP